MGFARFPLSGINRPTFVLIHSKPFHLVLNKPTSIFLFLGEKKLTLTLFDPLAIQVSPLSFVNRPVDILKLAILERGFGHLNHY